MPFWGKRQNNRSGILYDFLTGKYKKSHDYRKIMAFLFVAYKLLNDYLQFYNTGDSSTDNRLHHRDNSFPFWFNAIYPMAALPRSPVRILTHSSRVCMKIFPSPTLSV